MLPLYIYIEVSVCLHVAIYVELGKFGLRGGVQNLRAAVWEEKQKNYVSVTRF